VFAVSVTRRRPSPFGTAATPTMGRGVHATTGGGAAWLVTPFQPPAPVQTYRLMPPLVTMTARPASLAASQSAAGGAAVWSGNWSVLCGIVVPMPTFTLSAPVPPNTSALLAPTWAFAPSAVALLSAAAEGTDGPAPWPRKVLLDPVVLAFAGFAVVPARTPRAVLLVPVVLFISAFKPTATLASPVVLDMSAAAPSAVLALPVVVNWSAADPVAV